MKIAIVGSGLYGATVAAVLKHHHSVTVFEKRDHLGGNLYTTYSRETGHVSEYGAHIFHTNSEQIWDFINKYGAFNSYQHYVVGRLSDGNHVDLPFNLSMFEVLVGTKTPAELEAYLGGLPKYPGDDLESHCISTVGIEVYLEVVKNYTEKQWGLPCNQLPKSIIERLPVRLSRDRTYFKNARFQGMPVNGYTAIIDGMLGGASIVFKDITLVAMRDLSHTYDHVFFSGPVDRLFDYCLGTLPYRGLQFTHRIVSQQESQGAPVINDLSTSTKTRTIEHRLFYPETIEKRSVVVLTDEHPSLWYPGDVPYYPIRDHASSALHARYLDLADNTFTNLTIGGRLGSYRYYDMDQVIGMAMKDAKAIA